MSRKLENIALISSAGAGKTRALTERFLFLFLHKADYPLDSLYGITFTNEAAFEMKTRIIRYLDVLRTGKAADESEKGIVALFSHLFPDIKVLANRKKEYLLNNMSELNVATFHSLFASFLSSIPFAAGILPGYNIIDQTQEALIYESALDRYFENVVQNQGVLTNLTELLEQQETRIKGRINEIYSCITPWIGFLKGLVSKGNDVRLSIAKEEKRFIKLLKEFRKFLCEDGSQREQITNHIRNLCNAIEQYIQTKDFKMLSKSAYTESLLKRDIDTKSYMKKFANSCGERVAAYSDILSRLNKCTEVYLRLLSDYQIFIHLKPIVEIHGLFQKEKQDRNVITFDDIEAYTLEAFRNNPEPDYLYFKVGAELRHLMVDEFQDTSYRQLEIMEPLISEITSVEPHEKSIFYVGDPKQAIFRWRGGTPELFYTLIQRYPGKIKRDELTVNYRSKEEIVRFVNSVLDNDDEAKPGNTGGWICIEQCGDFVTKEEGDQSVMERTCSIIEKLHRDYGYEYSDIAVLVRTNHFGAAIAEEFSKRGIPCVSRSRADILSDNDVRFILALLRFLDNPENDFALMHVLLSSVFKIKEETLRRLSYTKKSLFLTLSDSHPEWNVTKILSRLLSLVHFLNPYELLYHILKELGIKVSYSLSTLLDVALEYAGQGFGSLSSFIDWLDRAGKSIEIKEIHAEGVKILTVHKAKGLEFEVVIVPETNWTLKSYENRQLLFSYAGNGSTPDKIYWRAYGKYFKSLKVAEQERLRNDALNLLYVALTRAKNGIYVLGFNHQKRGVGFWLDTISEKIGSTTYSVGEVIRKGRREIRREEKLYGSLSEETLVIKEERALYSPTERGIEIIDASRRRSIEFGTMIHRALSTVEWLDGTEIEQCIEDVVRFIKNLYARTPEESKEIEASVKALLIETLTDPGLRFLFYKDRRDIRCKNELPIYFEEEKKDVSGQIDRLMIEPDRMMIVDYKTGEEKPEYANQMRIYKKGMEKIYPGKSMKAQLIFLEKERGKKIVEV